MFKLKKIIILWCLVFCLSCSLFGQTNVVYLIPEGYNGGVIILYNQPDGIEPETSADGTIIYRIPKDGLLKIKQPFIRKAYKFKYYYVDEKANRTEIEYLYPETYVRDPGDTTSKRMGEISEDETNNGTFVMNNRNVNFNTKDGRVFINCFSVGRPKDARSLYIRMDDKITDIQKSVLKIPIRP